MSDRHDEEARRLLEGVVGLTFEVEARSPSVHPRTRAHGGQDAVDALRRSFAAALRDAERRGFAAGQMNMRGRAVDITTAARQHARRPGGGGIAILAEQKVTEQLDDAIRALPLEDATHA